MTEDPETVDRPRAEVIDAYTRHLRGRLAGGIDPAIVAAALADLLPDLGWRYIPRSVRIPEQGRRDPDGYRRGAEEVRKALREALTDEGER